MILYTNVVDFIFKIIGKSINKGARDQVVLIITRDKEELERLVEEFKLAGKKRVFPLKFQPL